MEQHFQTEDGAIQISYIKRTGSFTMTDEHNHNSYELYYLMKGERDYFIRDRTYRVEQGSFVFIKNGELHRTMDTGVPDHERVVFNFLGSVMDGFPMSGRNGVIKLSPQEEWKGEMIVRELIAEGKGSAQGRDLMIHSLFTQLLMLLFRCQAERGAEEASPSAVHRMMSDIAAYVGKHYDQPLRLRGVADAFFISPYYLSRKFKECTGFGFAEYIQLVRIREARRMLQETDAKMIEIAERTGIGPLANFHKLFKKMNGCSPMQYRKRQRAMMK